MSIKKSLLAVATATTVAVAGTGVATAAGDGVADTPTTTFSADGSLDDVDLSSQAGELFGSVEGGTWDLGAGIGGLDNFLDAAGLVVGSIALLPGLYYGVKEFQTFVDDITADVQGFLPQQ